MGDENDITDLRLIQPNHKKNLGFPKCYPLSIVRDSDERNASWSCVIGHLKENSVEVSDEKYIELLFTQGFFGKGTLSRSTPKFLEKKFRERGNLSKSKEPTEQSQSNFLSLSVDQNKTENSEKSAKRQKKDDLEIVLCDTSSTANEGTESLSEKEDSNSVTDVEPVTASKDDEKETLQLSLEEAYFLSYELGVLVVKDKDQSVEVKIELGHRAVMKENPSPEGFTYDWTIFVRGGEGSNIQFFVEKVVFHLHESFPNPKRVFKEPPYSVSESGYAGFIMPIDVYFRSREEPKKVTFKYDLYLRLVNSPVNSIRIEKLTFNNPSDDFRNKLIRAGGSVEVKIELGHRAVLKKNPSPEGFTHDWTIFVRGVEGNNIQFFVKKVVFHLHESFPNPKRVVKEPPYSVSESGYAGFIMPIDVYFRSREEPKKVTFKYDLYLRLENPPVNNIRIEKLTFNNPSDDFRNKLRRVGGPLDLMRLWHKFCEIHPNKNFPVMYTAYHHFRSKGWIVRSGMKYGCDFVLYKDGPPFYHSSYAVIVKAVKESNFRDVLAGDRPNYTWASLAAVHRICSHSNKGFLILYVIKPASISENETSTPFCVSQYLLEEVLVNRWVPSEEQKFES